MLGCRKRRLALLAGVLTLSAIASVVIVAVSNADPGPKAHPLHGEMRNIHHAPCNSAIGLCSVFEATGEIKGDGIVYIDTVPNADGYSKAHTVITTKKGTITCHEQAVFDVIGADHPFVDLCLIDGGTGKYDGATGYIQEVGTFDFAADLGRLDYYGKITYAD
jgi:excinuclease UvrABC nuclease subunit